MISGVSAMTLNYSSSTMTEQSASTPHLNQESYEQVITIERGRGVYDSYLKNGVVTKFQYVKASESN